MPGSSIPANDPCPCGSGRTYGQCCLRLDDAPPPSGRGADASEEIRQAMEGRSFDSEEEMEAFLDHLLEQSNRRPIDDFQGLTPQQMHALLYFPFDSPNLVTIPDRLVSEPSAPIMTLFELLAEAIGEKGLKPTATGNLPRKFLHEAAAVYVAREKQRENDFYDSIRTETDFSEMHITRLVAGLAGLVRKYQGKFILSRECRKLLAQGGSRAIYPRLLRTYASRFNWGYRDLYPDVPMIQQSFLFTLYLIHRFGNEWHTDTFYHDAFVRAFPMVVDEVEPRTWSTPEETLRRCYSLRCLDRFAAFMGLVEIEREQRRSLGVDPRTELRKLPLLDEAVIFKF